jgi:hypothetical protein
MNIGLVQINNTFSGFNYFPYSAGLIQSYAEKYTKIRESLKFNDIIYKRISIDSAISQLKILIKPY